MSVGSRLVLPRISPISPGADNREWRLQYQLRISNALRQGLAVVTSAQLSQAEFGNPEVVNPRREIGEIATDDVQLDLVECAGTGGCPKKDFLAVVFLAFRDAGGQE